MSSNAHKGTGFSSLPIEQGVILPVDFKDKLFPLHWNSSSRGIDPIVDVTTLVPDTKFNQVTAVEAGTTNIATNPRLSWGTTAPTSWYASNPTYTTLTNDTIGGKSMIKVNVDLSTQTSGSSGLTQTVSSSLVSSGDTLTLSVYVYDPYNQMFNGIGITFWYLDGTYTDFTWNNQGTKTITDLGNGFKRVTHTGTGDSTKTLDFLHLRIWNNTYDSKTIWVEKVQLEKLAWATSYTDTTRASGKLQYPATVMPTGDFTINVWAAHTGDTRMANNSTKFLAIGSSLTTAKLTMWNYYPIASGDSRKIIADFGNGTDSNGNTIRLYNDLMSSTPFVVNQWEMITITYASATNTFSFYRNGSDKTLLPSTNSTNTAVGNSASPTTRYPVSTLELTQSGWKYSNLLICPRVVPKEEIQAWYEYSRPFYDPYDYTAIYA